MILPTDIKTLISNIINKLKGYTDDKVGEHNDKVGNSLQYGHVIAGDDIQKISIDNASTPEGTHNGFYARDNHKHVINTATTSQKGVVQLDSTPTANSQNVLSSGVIKSQLDSKINSNNIINNLTTNDTSKVLGADQGVVLKGLIDGISEDSITLDVYQALSLGDDEYLASGNPPEPGELCIIQFNTASTGGYVTVYFGSSTSQESVAVLIEGYSNGFGMSAPRWVAPRFPYLAFRDTQSPNAIFLLNDLGFWKAIDNKVDKVNGKNLSTNDFTDEYKQKLDNTDATIDEKIDGAISEVNTVIEEYYDDMEG